MIGRPVQLLIVSTVMLSTACITVNVPIGGDPTSTAVVWAVEPEPPQSWNVSSRYVVQIKDFSSVQAIQRLEMTVITREGTLNRASTDVWSSRPMELLPDILMRDMVSTGAWGAVLRKPTMLPENLIIEGYIREFGGRVLENGWEAVIDVDVTVLNGDTYRLVFQKNYRFNWELSEPSYPALAGAIEILVGIWSEEVNQDIWASILTMN